MNKYENYSALIFNFGNLLQRLSSVSSIKADPES
jgi:hypothetical protein